MVARTYIRHAHQKGQLPGNICHASIITIGEDAPARRFADLTAKLIARRAASEPFWLLDQTSILVASRFLAAHDPDFRAIELAAATGLSFDDCFVSNGTAKEKQSMRAHSATLINTVRTSPSALPLRLGPEHERQGTLGATY